MKKVALFLFLSVCFAQQSCSSDSVGTEPEENPQDILFKDDFNFFDEKVWTKETHEPGWTNQELQAYDAAHVSVGKDGDKSVLILTAERKGNKIYSGRINSKGKKSFKYRKIEASIKLPKTNGTGIFKFRQRTKIFDFRHFHLLFTCCISANSATSDSVYPCRNLRIAFKASDTFAKFIPHFLCCFAGDFFIQNHPVSNHGNHISIFFHQTIDIYFHRYTLKCFLQIYHIHQLHTLLIHRMIVVVSKEILYPVRNRKTTMFIE